MTKNVESLRSQYYSTAVGDSSAVTKCRICSRISCQAVVWRDKIVLVGGFTGGWPNEKPVDRVLVFDPSTNKFEFTHSIPKARLRGATGAWRELPDSPNTRDHFQAVVVDSKLYAIAGRLSSEATQQP